MNPWIPQGRDARCGHRSGCDSTATRISKPSSQGGAKLQRLLSPTILSEWHHSIGGVVCLAVGLWLFYRSHADLSTNWSVTLELRENHQLITHGVYRSIRHPMYSAFLLYGVGADDARVLRQRVRGVQGTHNTAAAWSLVTGKGGDGDPDCSRVGG